MNRQSRWTHVDQVVHVESQEQAVLEYEKGRLAKLASSPGVLWNLSADGPGAIGLLLSGRGIRYRGSNAD